MQQGTNQFVLRKGVRFYGTKEKYEIHLNSHQRSFHICYADSSPVFDSLQCIERRICFLHTGDHNRICAFGSLVTLLATVIAVAVNTFFGIVAAWLLTKFSFRGKQVLATLIDIPFSISPVIVGLAF